MSQDPSAPFASDRFGYVEARHLLSRAGFGGPPSQIEQLAQMGLEGAVDALVDFHKVSMAAVRPDEFDRDIVQPATAEERREIRQARQSGDEAALERYRMQIQQRQRADRRQMAALQDWWLTRLLYSPRPLEEKLTLFWHGHFATNYRAVEDSYLMFLQNQLFRYHGAGSFAELCYGIIRDPAMLKFLNNDRNRRQAPNENFARELMELFTLGEGNVYTERDIKEAARALTGYTFDDNEFVFRRQWHDTASKHILGQIGVFDGDDLVRIILGKAAVAEFICYKLYRYFVNDGPAPLSSEARSFIDAMVRQFIRSQGQLRPVLKFVFRSQHFYETRQIASVIKSPVQLLAQTVRTLELPAVNVRVLMTALAQMGQNIFYPPSVKGWEVGRAWINTSTLFARQNAMLYLLRRQQIDSSEGGGDARGGESFQAMELVRGFTDDALETTNALLRRMLPLPASAAQVRHVKHLFDQRGVSEQTVRGALLLIAAMPEYQLS